MGKARGQGVYPSEVGGRVDLYSYDQDGLLLSITQYNAEYSNVNIYSIAMDTSLYDIRYCNGHGTILVFAILL